MDDVRVGPTVTIPAAELAWRFTRSSGAGGQHVNTTDSRVELTWDLERTTALTDAQRDRARRRLAGSLVDGTITVTASERRSQLRNREAAMERLAGLVAGAIEPPPPPRRPTRPSKSAQRRRVDAKKRRGETKRLRRPPD
jgi:ribosome-associated protein